MNPILISSAVSTLIVALGGGILIWWVLRHVRWSGIRLMLRFVLISMFILLVGVVGMILARSQPNVIPRATPIITPIESMTVAPGTLTETLSSTGALTPADETTLSFGASAPVTDVMVAVGDRVHQGDMLARIDTTAIDAQIRNAQLSLTQAQNSLNALTAPPSDIDVKLAQASVQSAQASLGSASQTGSSATDIQIAQLQEEISKNQLWQAQLQNGISQDNARPGTTPSVASQIQTAASLAQSESSVQAQINSTNSVLNQGPSASSLASANAQLLSAQANLDSLMAGPSAQQLRQAQIAVQTAQLGYDSAQALRDNATITAPFDGVVAAVNIVAGSIPPSTGAITLINTSDYTITLSVDEKDITSLQVGQTVNLSVQALGNSAARGNAAPLTGSVTRIDPTPALSGQLVNYNVEVTLDPTQAPVRPGMSAVADVILQELNNVLVVPNRFITTNATTQETTVKVQTGAATYQDVVVTLGTQTATDSEIVSGVRAGQTLVILPTAAQIAAAQGGLGLFGGLGGRGAGGGAFPGGGAAGGGGFTGGGGGAGGGGFTGGGRGGG